MEIEKLSARVKLKFCWNFQNYIIPSNPAVVPTIMKKQNSAKSLGNLFKTKLN